MIARQGAVLLGRTTYDQWSRYWPTSTEQPFADFINGVRKYVVTSTPLAGGWAEAEAVSGPLEEVVARGEGERRTPTSACTPASPSRRRSSPRDSSTSCACPSAGCWTPSGRGCSTSCRPVVEMELLEAAPTPTGSLWLRYRLSRQSA